jgi:hypothetical protein
MHREGTAVQDSCMRTVSRTAAAAGDMVGQVDLVVVAERQLLEQQTQAVAVVERAEPVTLEAPVEAVCLLLASPDPRQLLHMGAYPSTGRSICW